MSCGVSVHMVLLFLKGSIVCSGSGHFNPTIGISTTWRWNVFWGRIICSYLIQHAFLALWYSWRCSCYASYYVMTVGFLASCDEIFGGCCYMVMGEIVCGCLIWWWILWFFYEEEWWFYAYVNINAILDVASSFYYDDVAYVDYCFLMSAWCCLLLVVVGWYATLDDDCV